MVEKPHRSVGTSPRNGKWLSLLVFAALGLLSFFAWRIQKAHEESNFAAETALASTTIVACIDADLTGRLGSLRRMAERWTIRGGTPEREFRHDAAALIADQPGFRALGWVDEDLYIRWVVPVEGNVFAFGLNMGFESLLQAALGEAKELRRPMATAPFELVQGGKGFLVCFPMYGPDTFEGFIFAGFNIQEWLEYVLRGRGRLSADDFEISASIDGVPVYGFAGGWADASGSGCSSATSATYVLDHRISVCVRPSLAYAAASRTNLPLITVSVGLIFSFLGAFVVHLLNLMRAEATISNQARRMLETEIAERAKIVEFVKIREQQFRLLLDSTAEAIFAINRNGACTFANPACLRMLGYEEIGRAHV